MIALKRETSGSSQKDQRDGGGGADIISHLKDQQFPFDCDAPVPRFNESTVKFCWIFARGGTKVRSLAVSQWAEYRL